MDRVVCYVSNPHESGEHQIIAAEHEGFVMVSGPIFDDRLIGPKVTHVRGVLTSALRPTSIVYWMNALLWRDHVRRWYPHVTNIEIDFGAVRPDIGVVASPVLDAADREGSSRAWRRDRPWLHRPPRQTRHQARELLDRVHRPERRCRATSRDARSIDEG